MVTCIHHSRASHYVLLVLAMEPEGSSMLGKYPSLSDIPALYRIFLVFLVTDVALHLPQISMFSWNFPQISHTHLEHSTRLIDRLEIQCFRRVGMLQVQNISPEIAIYCPPLCAT